MRRNQTIVALVAGAVLFGAAGMAFAQSATDAIKARQDHMKAFGADVKIVSDQLKTDAPDKAAIAAAAKRIADTSKGLATWFPAGSGSETGVKTRALPEIWVQTVEFKTAADTATTQMASFAKVAAAGDLDAIKAGAKQLTDSCGGCHNKFRAKEQPAK